MSHQAPPPDDPSVPPPGPPSPPPYGDMYGQPPPAPSGQRYGQFPQPPQAYPQQELLPQERKPRRSRLPLYIALGVALAIIVGGVAVWLLLRDNGESTRAQYCAAIKEVAPRNDLLSAVVGADATTLGKAQTVADLAPSAVKKDWKTLTDVVRSAQTSSSLDPTTALTALGALKSIVSDSNANCGTAYTLPLSP